MQQLYRDYLGPDFEPPEATIEDGYARPDFSFKQPELTGSESPGEVLEHSIYYGLTSEDIKALDGSKLTFLCAMGLL